MEMTIAPGDGSAGSSGGFAAAIEGGRLRKGGGAPLRGYSDVIRQRWRQPRRRGELADANAVAEDVNPLCGDRVRMMLRLDRGTIRAARFLGDACAICTAAADILLELVEGQAAAAPAIADVLERLEAEIRPTRMRCVTLPLSVLHQALGEPNAAR
jgi:nitrogen fixation NifU-like protein